jgi:hypothetical protein
MNRIGATCAAALAALLTCITSPAAHADFCWKQTEPRGVGTIPKGCPAGQENNSALCYTNCRSGYTGNGPVCWGQCPSGYSDSGAVCGKPSAYGRGAGYPWKFGDGLNDNGMYHRCESANGRGNCEKWGAVVYPKCRGGFHTVGCCTCSPDCPSGFSDGGATCNKPTYTRGVGTIPTVCSSDRYNQAGLCYRNCDAGYSTGLGPVCWKSCPASAPFNCGAGCSKDLAECQANTLDQVMSVMSLVVTIMQEVETGGFSLEWNELSNGGKAAYVQMAKQAIKNAAVKNMTKDEVIKTLRDQSINIGLNQMDNLANAATGQDFDFYSLDPTGIASVVKAYNHKVCPSS